MICGEDHGSGLSLTEDISDGFGDGLGVAVAVGMGDNSGNSDVKIVGTGVVAGSWFSVEIGKGDLVGDGVTVMGEGTADTPAT